MPIRESFPGDALRVAGVGSDYVNTTVSVRSIYNDLLCERAQLPQQSFIAVGIMVEFIGELGLDARYAMQWPSHQEAKTAAGGGGFCVSPLKQPRHIHSDTLPYVARQFGRRQHRRRPAADVNLPINVSRQFFNNDVRPADNNAGR
jgi:hypothetical protein